MFRAKDGGPRKHSTIAVRKAFKGAGINNATIHDLRHTFASRLATAGMGINKIQVLLGHTSIKATMRYAHLIPNDVAKEAVGILEKERRLEAVKISAEPSKWS